MKPAEPPHLATADYPKVTTYRISGSILLLLAILAAFLLYIAVSAGDTSYLGKGCAVLGSACVGVLVRESAIRLRGMRTFLKYLAPYLPIAGYFCASLFCVLYIISTIPQNYPKEDGMIADFDSLTGGPLNAFKLPFFTFSDSQQGMNSTFSYARVPEDDVSKGCLEIVYQLQAQESNRTPYIGLLTDFSDPFPVPYNLSNFKALRLRVRTGQPHSNSPIHVFLILYSGNIRTSRTEQFPRYEIPQVLLTTGWADVKVHFDDFSKAIGSAGEQRPLDPKQIYRLGILITGPSNATTHGRIYIDDLGFAK